MALIEVPIPTQDEKDALTGTNGAPGAGNRYVTDADPRNVDARTPVAHVHAQADITGLLAALAALTATDALKEDAANKGAAGGYAQLDGAGKLPTILLPSLAISSRFVVNSEAAMVALAAEEGDFAIRTDVQQTFIHNGGSTGTVADWTALATPSDAVSSVAGKSGVVTLDEADIAGLAADLATIFAHIADSTGVHGIADTAALILEGDARLANARTPTAHAATHATGGTDAITVAQAQVTGLAAALAALAPLASPALTGHPTVPTQARGSNNTDAASTAYVDREVSTVALNTVNDNYTLVLADAGKRVEMNVVTAKVITIPPDVFPVGTAIELARYGTGALAIAPGAGVTLHSKGEFRNVTNQYGSASAYQRAANEWILVGDLS